MKNEERSNLNSKITPVFVIGAMKSGTTSLFNYLKYQEEICFSLLKEPEYFSLKMGLKKYKNGDFWDLFDIKPNHKYVFDGSTGYTKYPAESGVPKRIYDYGLKPKFIYLIRNPYDRIQSHYNSMKGNLNWQGKLISQHLINVSNYYLQLEQYREYFDKKDFLIIDFDDVTSKPEIVLQKIGKHIGLNELKLVDQNIKSNITKPTSRNELLLKSKFAGKVAFLPKPLKTFGKKIISILFVKKKNRLSKKQKEIIYHQLKDDMHKFKLEYGYPVENWGF